MNKSKITSVIILVLLAGNVFFGIKYLSAVKEIRQIKTSIKTQQMNGEIVEFTKLFIEGVLKAKTDVDFETRLKLENLVRNFGDEEISTQWSKFIESKTEAIAQEEVKNLLGLLINKIDVK